MAEVKVSKQSSKTVEETHDYVIDDPPDTFRLRVTITNGSPHMGPLIQMPGLDCRNNTLSLSTDRAIRNLRDLLSRILAEEGWEEVEDARPEQES